MKKESIHKVGKRKKPRVPMEGQERLHQGGAHQDKKKYKREKIRKNVREDPDVFLFWLMRVLQYRPYLLPTSRAF